MTILNSWNSTTTKPGQDVSALHIHEYCELLYIKQGAVNIKIGEKSYTVHAGQLIIINPMEMHSLVPIQLPYSRIGIYIGTDILKQENIAPLLCSVLLNNYHIFNFSDNCKLIEKFYEEYNHNQPYRNEMLIAILRQILIFLYRMSPESFVINTKDSVMEEVKVYIENNLTDFMMIKELAAKYYLTPSHFIARFKKHTGYTPQKYHNLCRITRARSLLLHSDLSLNIIAERCGYADLNSFVRSFRKTMNITPGRFRLLSGTENFEI